MLGKNSRWDRAIGDESGKGRLAVFPLKLEEVGGVLHAILVPCSWISHDTPRKS